MSSALRALPPGFFALGALVAWLGWLVAPGIAARRWSAPPLRVWDAANDSETWVRNRSEGWAYAIGESFAAADSPGVALRFRPNRRGQAPLEVRWRASGEKEWRSRTFVHDLGRSYQFCRLDDDPDWSGEIGEIAVRVADLHPPEIRSLSVESRGVTASLRRAWAEFRSVERFGDVSINGLTGTRVAGVSLSAVAALVLVAYLAPTLALARRAPARAWRSFFALAAILWVGLDLRFSADLIANARADVRRYPAIGAADAVVQGGPGDFARLVAVVRSRVPDNVRVAFLTDDPRFAIRAKYVFYPRPVGRLGPRTDLAQNDYFVLFRDSGAHFDADSRMLRLRDGREIEVRPVAKAGGGAIFAVRKRDTLPRRGAAAALAETSVDAPEGATTAALALAVLSLLVPWCLGWCVVAALDRRRHIGRWCAVGIAYPCGALLASALLLALGLLHIPLNRGSAAAAAALAAVPLLAQAWRRSPPAVARVAAPAPLRRAWEWALLALLAAKVGAVAVDLLHRPLSAWDSFAVWGLRAKVWAARGALVLERGDPFFLGGGARADYPPHVSLLQTWTALWMGSWNDVLVNLPWGMYYASALLFTFGVLRRRVAGGTALAAVAALAGLPLFAVHAAVAGYADLVLAVHFLIAAAAIFLWASEGQPRSWLAVSLLFTATLPAIKLEGVPLAAVCALALVAQSGALRRRGVPRLLLGGVVAAALLFALVNPTLRSFVASSALRPRSLQPVLRALFAAGNWNLLWTLLAVVVVLGWRRWWRTPRAWLLAMIAAPALLFLYVLLGTAAARFALLSTADSRLFLTLSPLVLVFVFDLAAALTCHGRRSTTIRSGAAPG